MPDNITTVNPNVAFDKVVSAVNTKQGLDVDKVEGINVNENNNIVGLNYNLDPSVSNNASNSISQQNTPGVFGGIHTNDEPSLSEEEFNKRLLNNAYQMEYENRMKEERNKIRNQGNDLTYADYAARDIVQVGRGVGWILGNIGFAAHELFGSTPDGKNIKNLIEDIKTGDWKKKYKEDTHLGQYLGGQTVGMAVDMLAMTADVPDSPLTALFDEYYKKVESIDNPILKWAAKTAGYAFHIQNFADAAHMLRKADDVIDPNNPSNWLSKPLKQYMDVYAQGDMLPSKFQFYNKEMTKIASMKGLSSKERIEMEVAAVDWKNMLTTEDGQHWIVNNMAQSVSSVFGFMAVTAATAGIAGEAGLSEKGIELLSAFVGNLSETTQIVVEQSYPQAVREAFLKHHSQAEEQEIEQQAYQVGIEKGYSDADTKVFAKKALQAAYTQDLLSTPEGKIVNENYESGSVQAYVWNLLALPTDLFEVNQFFKAGKLIKKGIRRGIVKGVEEGVEEEIEKTATRGIVKGIQIAGKIAKGGSELLMGSVGEAWQEAGPNDWADYAARMAMRGKSLPTFTNPLQSLREMIKYSSNGHAIPDAMFAAASSLFFGEGMGSFSDAVDLADRLKEQHNVIKGYEDFKSATNIDIKSRMLAIQLTGSKIDKLNKIIEEEQKSDNPNVAKITQAQNDILTFQALRAFKFGTTEQLIGMYKYIANHASDNEAKTMAESAINTITSLEEAYNEAQKFNYGSEAIFELNANKMLMEKFLKISQNKVDFQLNELKKVLDKNDISYITDNKTGTIKYTSKEDAEKASKFEIKKLYEDSVRKHNKYKKEHSKLVDKYNEITSDEYQNNLKLEDESVDNLQHNDRLNSIKSRGQYEDMLNNAIDKLNLNKEVAKKVKKRMLDTFDLFESQKQRAKDKVVAKRINKLAKRIGTVGAEESSKLAEQIRKHQIHQAVSDKLSEETKQKQNDAINNKAKELKANKNKIEAEKKESGYSETEQAITKKYAQQAQDIKQEQTEKVNKVTNIEHKAAIEESKQSVNEQHEPLNNNEEETIAAFEPDKVYNLGEILTILKLKNTGRYLVTLIRKITPFLNRLNTKIVFTNSRIESNENAFGIYDMNSNTITISLDKLVDSFTARKVLNNNLNLSDFIATVVTHEAIHGLTYHALFLFKNNKALFNKTFSKEQRNAIEGLNDIFDYLNRNKTILKEYGITSPEELIANLADEEFVSQLRGIRVIKNIFRKIANIGENIFNGIINLIRNFFNIKSKSKSVDKALFNILSSIITDNNGLSLIRARNLLTNMVNQEVSKLETAVAYSEEADEQNIDPELVSLFKALWEDSGVSSLKELINHLSNTGDKAADKENAKFLLKDFDTYVTLTRLSGHDISADNSSVEDLRATLITRASGVNAILRRINAINAQLKQSDTKIPTDEQQQLEDKKEVITHEKNVIKRVINAIGMVSFIGTGKSKVSAFQAYHIIDKDKFYKGYSVILEPFEPKTAKKIFRKGDSEKDITKIIDFFRELIPAKYSRKGYFGSTNLKVKNHNNEVYTFEEKRVVTNQGKSFFEKAGVSFGNHVNSKLYYQEETNLNKSNVGVKGNISHNIADDFLITNDEDYEKLKNATAVELKELRFNADRSSTINVKIYSKNGSKVSVEEKTIEVENEFDQNITIGVKDGSSYAGRLQTYGELTYKNERINKPLTDAELRQEQLKLAEVRRNVVKSQKNGSSFKTEVYSVEQTGPHLNSKNKTTIGEEDNSTLIGIVKNGTVYINNESIDEIEGTEIGYFHSDLSESTVFELRHYKTINGIKYYAAVPLYMYNVSTKNNGIAKLNIKNALSVFFGKADKNVDSSIKSAYQKDAHKINDLLDILKHFTIINPLYLKKVNNRKVFDIERTVNQIKASKQFDKLNLIEQNGVLHAIVVKQNGDVITTAVLLDNKGSIVNNNENLDKLFKLLDIYDIIPNVYNNYDENTKVATFKSTEPTINYIDYIKSTVGTHWINNKTIDENGNTISYPLNTPAIKLSTSGSTIKTVPLVSTSTKETLKEKPKKIKKTLREETANVNRVIDNLNSASEFLPHSSNELLVNTTGILPFIIKGLKSFSATDQKNLITALYSHVISKLTISNLKGDDIRNIINGLYDDVIAPTKKHFESVIGDAEESLKDVADKDLKKILSDKIEETKKLLESYDELKDNFEDVKNVIKRQAYRFANISDDSDIEDEEDVIYTKESYEIQPVISASKEIKLFMSKIESGHKTIFGLNEFVDYDKAFETLLKIASLNGVGGRTFDELLETLSDYEKVIPWMKNFVDNLRNADKQLKNKLMYSAMLTPNDMKFVMVNTQNNGLIASTHLMVYSTALTEARQIIFNGWKENFKVADIHKNSEKLESAIKEFSSIKSDMRNEYNQIKKGEVLVMSNALQSKIRDWLFNIGILVSKQTISEIAKDPIALRKLGGSPVGLLKTSARNPGLLGGLYNLLNKIKNEPNTAIKLADADIGLILNSLATIESKYSDIASPIMFRDADKSISGIVVSKFGTDRLNLLTDENDDYTRTSLAKDPFSTHSSLLRLLMSSKFIRSKVQVEHVGLTSIKKFGTRAFGDNKITAVSKIDKQYAKVGLFQDIAQGKAPKDKFYDIPMRMIRIMFPTMSDKKQMMLLYTPGYDFNSIHLNNENGYFQFNDNTRGLLFDQLILPDFNRMLQYHIDRSSGKEFNVEGYNEGAQLFLMFPQFNSLKTTDGQLLTSAIKQNPENFNADTFADMHVIDENGNATTIMDKLVSIINNEITRKVSFWNSKKISNGMDSRYMSKFEHDGYKLEHAAADYVVNNLIGQAQLKMLVTNDMAYFSQKKLFKNFKYEVKDNNSEVIETINKADITDPTYDGLMKGIEKAYVEHKISYEEYTLIQDNTRPDPTSPMQVDNLDKLYSKIIIDKLGTNLGKRYAELLAPGYKLANTKVENNNDELGNKTEGDKYGKYIEITLNDKVSIASNIEFLIRTFYGVKAVTDNIQQSLNQIKDNYTTDETKPFAKAQIKRLTTLFPKIADYFDIEGTDAQEYVTAKEHIDNMFNQGAITEEKYNELQQKIKNQQRAIGENREINEQNLISDDDLDLILQIMKPVATGSAWDESLQRMRMIYIKSSAFPLLPQITNGTPLNNLRIAMEKLQMEKGLNVRAAYKTAIKVGATETGINPFSTNTDEFSSNNLNNSSIVLSRNNYRVQQHNPVHMLHGTEDNTRMGSQLFKLLFGDGVTEMDGFELNGKSYNGRQLLTNYNETFLKILDGEVRKLFNELGLNDNGVPKNVGTTIQYISKLVKREALTRGYSLQEIESIDINSITDPNTGKEIINFKVPLWGTASSVRFESLLNSLITNRLAKIKMPGYSYVVASQEGFQRIATANQKQSIIYTKHWDGESLKAAGINKNEQTEINIYAGANENTDLSNFAYRPFTYESGITGTKIQFNTVEGAFQAAKLEYANLSTKEFATIETKLSTATGYQAKKIGRQIKGLDIKAWDKASPKIMKDILLESFKQNPKALQRLLSTGDAVLTHKQDKGKWGELFPKLLMEVRDELRNKSKSKTTVENTNESNKAQVFLTPRFRKSDGSIFDLWEKDENGEYKYVNENNGQLTLKDGVIDDEILNAIAYRIPTSSHALSAGIEIAGFIPQIMGDMMIVPKEFTVQQGLDYDVDKEFTYQLAHHIDNDGHITTIDKYIESLPGETTEDKIESKIYDLRLKISARTKALRIGEAFKEQSIDDAINLIDSAIDNNLSNEEIDRLIDQQLEISNSSDINNQMTNFKNEIKDYLKEIAMLKSVESKMLKNNFIRINQSILSNPKMARRINKVLSMDIAREQAELLGDKRNYNTVLSDDYNEDKMELGATGQMGIGVYANYTTTNSLLQQLEKPITAYDEENNPLSISFGGYTSVGMLGRYISIISNDVLEKIESVINNKSNLSEKEKGDYIEQIKRGKIQYDELKELLGEENENLIENVRPLSTVFDERMNTATDNEKEQIMGRTNINRFTIGVDSLLVLLGFDLGENIIVDESKGKTKGNISKASIGYFFLSQPVIKELVKKLEENESILNKRRKSFEDICNELVTAYSQTTTDISDIELTAQYMWDMINTSKQQTALEDDETRNDYNAGQLKVLIMFRTLYQVQKTLSRIQSAINITKDGMTKSLPMAMEKYEVIANLFRESGQFPGISEIIGEESEDGVPFYDYNGLGNTVKVKPTTALGKMIVETLGRGVNLWSNYFLYGKPAFNTAVSRIGNIVTTNLESPETRAEFISKFGAGFRNYLNSTSSFDFYKGRNIFDERIRLLKDTKLSESLASYLLKVSNTILKNNGLVSAFRYEINKNGYSRIIYDNTTNNRFNNEFMFQSFTELYNSERPLPDFDGHEIAITDEIENELSLSTEQKNKLTTDWEGVLLTDNNNTGLNIGDEVIQVIDGNRFIVTYEGEQHSTLANAKYGTKVLPQNNQNTQSHVFSLRSVYTTKNLADDLAEYAFITGGNQGATEFSKFIPPEYLKINGVYRMFNVVDISTAIFNNYFGSTQYGRPGYNGELSSYEIQFLQHNPDMIKTLNAKTVKKFTGRTINELSKLDTFTPPTNSPLIENNIAIFKTNKVGESGYNIFLYNSDSKSYIKIQTLGKNGTFEYDPGKIIGSSIINGFNESYIDTLANRKDEEDPYSTYKVTSKDMGTILDMIRRKSRVPWYSRLSNQLLLSDKIIDIAKNVKIKLIDDDNVPTALYNNKTNTISINSNITNEELEKAILHEFIHAIVNSELLKYTTRESAPENIKVIFDLMDEVKNKFNITDEEIESNFNTIAKTGAFVADNEGSTFRSKLLYSLSNTREFVAMTLTDEELQSELKTSLESEKPIFTKIAEVIKSILQSLGVNIELISKNLLNAILSADIGLLINGSNGIKDDINNVNPYAYVISNDDLGAITKEYSIGNDKFIEIKSPKQKDATLKIKYDTKTKQFSIAFKRSSDSRFTQLTETGMKIIANQENITDIKNQDDFVRKYLKLHEKEIGMNVVKYVESSSNIVYEANDNSDYTKSITEAVDNVNSKLKTDNKETEQQFTNSKRTLGELSYLNYALSLTRMLSGGNRESKIQALDKSNVDIPLWIVPDGTYSNNKFTSNNPKVMELYNLLGLKILDTLPTSGGGRKYFIRSIDQIEKEMREVFFSKDKSSPLYNILFTDNIGIEDLNALGIEKLGTPRIIEYYDKDGKIKSEIGYVFPQMGTILYKLLEIKSKLTGKITNVYSITDESKSVAIGTYGNKTQTNLVNRLIKESAVLDAFQTDEWPISKRLLGDIRNKIAINREAETENPFSEFIKFIAENPDTYDNSKLKLYNGAELDKFVDNFISAFNSSKNKFDTVMIGYNNNIHNHTVTVNNTIRAKLFNGNTNIMNVGEIITNNTPFGNVSVNTRMMVTSAIKSTIKVRNSNAEVYTVTIKTEDGKTQKILVASPELQHDIDRINITSNSKNTIFEGMSKNDIVKWINDNNLVQYSFGYYINVFHIGGRTFNNTFVNVENIKKSMASEFHKLTYLYSIMKSTNNSLHLFTDENISTNTEKSDDIVQTPLGTMSKSDVIEKLGDEALKSVEGLVSENDEC